MLYKIPTTTQDQGSRVIPRARRARQTPTADATRIRAEATCQARDAVGILKNTTQPKHRAIIGGYG